MNLITMISLITKLAIQYDIPPNLALAVAKVESNFNPSLIGQAGEIGVFQLKPESFPQVKNLKNVETNIREGIKYLAWNKKHCKHNVGFEYVVCYNYGIENAKHVKYPKKFPYYLRVKAAMKEL